MASPLLHLSPNLSQHLSDPSLTPLLTSACSQPTLESLTALASAALTADAALAHLDMGAPLRILVEYDAEPPSPSLSAISAFSFSLPSVTMPPAAAAGAALGAGAGNTVNHAPNGNAAGTPNVHNINASPSHTTTYPLGPILLHSFIAPPSTTSTAPASNPGPSEIDPTTTTADHNRSPSPLPIEDPPLLVATVVGVSSDVTSEARRAACRMERIARQLHREWEVEERGGIGASVGGDQYPGTGEDAAAS
ncbi:hypothetical protein Cpir12675_003804 [Ceratocystis pirilliformis]|uniref:Uncharacterized protein n=1 Tax=Ceratocystis pirilliformis TaxID=259994 RepID=A0ABR3Z1N2_9PEZI